MDAPVIVVGAGPTGMMLAGELRLTGVHVVVLERLERRTGESRGLGFTARTLETFDQRGLLPRFGEIETGTLGRFGGLPLDFGVLGETTCRAAKGGAAVRHRDPPGGMAHRPRGRRPARPRGALGARRRPRCRGGGTRPGRDAHAAGRLPGRMRRRTQHRAQGCRVRLPGTAATTEMYLADIKGVDLEPRMTGMTLPGGMAMAGPLPGGITRIIVCERGTPPRRREGPPPFEELLIRPDGYVAWAAPGGHHDLPTTLERRFGTP